MMALSHHFPLSNHIPRYTELQSCVLRNALLELLSLSHRHLEIVRQFALAPWEPGLVTTTSVSEFMACDQYAHASSSRNSLCRNASILPSSQCRQMAAAIRAQQQDVQRHRGAGTVACLGGARR